MEYIMSFLEGIITFISPCLLPMLPIYISYFAGGEIANNKRQTIKNATGFVLGFTIVFVMLGTFASSIGTVLRQYNQILQIVFGIIMILFGLNFMGILNIKILNNTKSGVKAKTKDLNFISSLTLGIIFSITWTPCIGTFLGSALMLAATANHVIEGTIMLLCFSLGLAIPFLISAFLIHKLKTAFDYIKAHYKIINRICGIFLIGIGILMITGYMRYFLSLLSM